MIRACSEQNPSARMGKRRERRKSDDDDDEGEDPAEHAARQRERARCAAIISSPAAAARPDMAAHFAFATNLSRSEAVNALRAVAAGQPVQAAAPAPTRRDSFSARIDRQRSPNLGDGSGAEAPAADTPDAVARQMLAAAGVKI